MRFSLRTLIISLTLLSIALGIPIFWLRYVAERQRNAIGALQSLNAEAAFTKEPTSPPWWKRAVRNWIDRDAFRDIQSIVISEDARELEQIFALLGELTNLRQVLVRSSDLTDKHLVILSEIKTLKELHCSEAAYTAEGVRSLLARNQFELLHVPSAKFDDQMLATLGKNDELIEASFNASNATADGFANLANCPKLRALLLYRVTDLGACLRSSAISSRLTNLSATDSEISQDDIGEIAKFPKLYLLALDKCQLNVASLEPIAQLPVLRILDLRHTPLSPGNLDIVKRLKTLMVIDLHGGVNDENIEEFLQSPVIRTLSFSKSDLSDEGIQKLAGRPTFQYLFLPNDTRCTVEGIRKLQESAAITVGIGDDDGSIIYRPGGIVDDRRKKRVP